MEFDFAPAVEDINKVPENFRGAYVEKDGKFVVDDKVKGLLEAAGGFRKALNSERGITKSLKEQKDIASLLEPTGFESVEAMKAKIDEITEQLASKSKIDPAKIRAEIEATFSKERDKLTGDNTKMLGTLKKYLVDGAATGAIADAKGQVKLLLPLIQAKADVVADGDAYVVRIKDEDGSYRGDGKGGYMTVNDFVKELKASADYGRAFDSDSPGGSGGNNANKANRQVTQQTQQRQNAENMSATDKIAAGLAKRG